MTININVLFVSRHGQLLQHRSDVRNTKSKLIVYFTPIYSDHMEIEYAYNAAELLMSDQSNKGINFN